ncbi:MAG: hypothetical protein OXC14_21500 [Rhodospirillaceae bacterium]|nr:hypothetical protein [Rhodospirillaceae bacterium]
MLFRSAFHAMAYSRGAGDLVRGVAVNDNSAAEARGSSHAY